MEYSLTKITNQLILHENLVTGRNRSHIVLCAIINRMQNNISKVIGHGTYSTIVNKHNIEPNVKTRKEYLFKMIKNINLNENDTLTLLKYFFGCSLIKSKCEPNIWFEENSHMFGDIGPIKAA